MTLTTRENAENIDASWFNSMKDAIENDVVNTKIKTANYTIVSGDKLITVNTSIANITITLPLLAGNKGKSFIIKKTDSNAHDVIINANGAETIDDVITKTLSKQYDFAFVMAGATKWHIVALDEKTLNGKIIDADNSTITNLAHGSEVDSPSSGVHGVSGSVVGTSSTQTFTKKTFDDEITQKQIVTPSNPSAGYNKLYPKSGNKYYVLDSSGNETELGTGASAGGVGGINYIDNFDAEVNTSGWATYADVAGVKPVDGTGGTANITWTRSTSLPLQDVASFLLTKDAANRQGEGVSNAFTLTQGHFAEPQVCRMYVLPDSNYVDESLEIFIYDVTNSKLIPCTPSKIQKTGLAERQYFEFQTSANGTSYRLIIHCNSTTVTAYTVKFDMVEIGPTEFHYGSQISDWVGYTPVTQGLGTIASVDVKWRRVGDSLEIQGNLTAGTSTASEIQIGLPSGLVVDSDYASISIVGKGNKLSVSQEYYEMLATAGDTYLNVGLQQFDTNRDAFTPIVGTLGPVTQKFGFNAKVKIAGWGSSQLSSSMNSGRLINCEYEDNSGETIINYVTLIPFKTKVTDTHGAWDGNTYTIREAGEWIMLGNCRFNGAYSGGLFLYKNNVIFRHAGSGDNFSYSVPLKGKFHAEVGDTLNIKGNAGVLSAGASSHWISFHKIQGPSQIMASEKITFIATSNDGQTVNDDTVIFEDVEKDTHSNYNNATGEYTIRAADSYHIDTGISRSAGGYPTILKIMKNGTVIRSTINLDSASNRELSKSISCDLDLEVGDIIRIDCAVTASLTLYNNAIYNWFNIHRI
jgi:hypothetical protein